MRGARRGRRPSRPRRRPARRASRRPASSRATSRPHPPHLVYAENPPQNEPRSTGGWEVLRWGYEELRRRLARPRAGRARRARAALDHDGRPPRQLRAEPARDLRRADLPAPVPLPLRLPPPTSTWPRRSSPRPTAPGLVDQRAARRRRARRLRDDRRAAPGQPGRGTSRSCRSRPTTTRTTTPTPRSTRWRRSAPRPAARSSAPGRRAVLLASNSLSHLHWDREPDLPEDMGAERPFDHHQYAGDMELLQAVREGPTVAAAGRPSRSTSRRPQSETKAGSLTWLLAAMGWPDIAGDVLAYGTVIATGNAVVEWVPVTPAALVPGMPHLLAGRPGARAGRELAARHPDGRRPAARRAASRPCCCSRPSGSPCSGHQVQCDAAAAGTPHRRELVPLRLRAPAPRPRRRRRARPRAGPTRSTPPGMQARRTRYEGFPVDTGTVTASRAARPARTGPLGHGLVQPLRRARRRWRTVAAAGVRAARRPGRTVGVVAVSGLSSGLIPRWITPAEDRVEDAEHDRWNRKVLDAIRAGDRDEVARLSPEYAARGAGRQPVPGARVPRPAAGRGRRPGRGAGLRARSGARARRSCGGASKREGVLMAQGSGVHRGRGLRADLRRRRRDGEGHRGRGPRGRPGSAAGWWPWPWPATSRRSRRPSRSARRSPGRSPGAP